MDKKISFTTMFMKKFESLAKGNPALAKEVYEIVTNFNLEEQKHNIRHVEDNGFVLNIKGYKMFFNVEEEKIVFFAIFNFDEMLKRIVDEYINSEEFVETR